MQTFLNSQDISERELEKRILRRVFIKKRKSLTDSYRERADEAICRSAIQAGTTQKSTLFVGYLTDGFEPDLGGCFSLWLRQGKRCFFPRFSKTEKGTCYEIVEVYDLENDLRMGAYGIPEPKHGLNRADISDLCHAVWLVPGVVFDRFGNRLGRGKGVYDQLLKDVKGLRIGVFYGCQEAEFVPVDSHDQSLRMVITEKETLQCKR